MNSTAKLNAIETDPNNQRYVDELAAFDRLPKQIRDFIRDNPLELLAKDIEPLVERWGGQTALDLVKHYAAEWRKEHPLFDPGKR